MRIRSHQDWKPRPLTMTLKYTHLEPKKRRPPLTLPQDMNRKITQKTFSAEVEGVKQRGSITSVDHGTVTSVNSQGCKCTVVLIVIEFLKTSVGGISDSWFNLHTFVSISGSWKPLFVKSLLLKALHTVHMPSHRGLITHAFIHRQVSAGLEAGAANEFSPWLKLSYCLQ